MFLQRIRVRFAKLGDLSAISHLDLMRAFERALRRAGLPLRMSEGFNPHPRISFPAALGVGIEGTDEVMEFDLSDWVPKNDVERRLREQLPQGLELKQMELGDPHKIAQAREALFAIQPSAEIAADPRWAAAAVESLMARAEIPVERKRKGKMKTVNLRPLILSIQHEGETLIARVRAGNEGSVHPEELLVALGFDMTAERGEFRIIRTRVLLEN
jgi:radical SAM-linked protein